MKTKKTVLFFDGDGTLWYPETTRREKSPTWLYKDFPKAKDYLKHLILTPSLVKTLTILKKRGMILVALSTHPHSRVEADLHMINKMKHLKLDDIFDSIQTARPFPWGKGKAMESFLKKSRIPKTRALLVGDSYTYDYLSAKGVGIDCLLIKTPYMKHPLRGRKVQKTISHLKELLEVV